MQLSRHAVIKKYPSSCTDKKLLELLLSITSCVLFTLWCQSKIHCSISRGVLYYSTDQTTTCMTTCMIRCNIYCTFFPAILGNNTWCVSLRPEGESFYPFSTVIPRIKPGTRHESNAGKFENACKNPISFPGTIMYMYC